jgi:hypothetical protein
MNRVWCTIAVTVSVGLGWTIGRAQTTQPDFELSISAPAGETRVQCLRGCDLSWVGRGLNPNATATQTFTFRCSGAERCSSGTVGGWSR